MEGNVVPMVIAIIVIIAVSALIVVGIIASIIKLIKCEKSPIASLKSCLMPSCSHCAWSQYDEKSSYVYVDCTCPRALEYCERTTCLRRTIIEASKVRGTRGCVFKPKK